MKEKRQLRENQCVWKRRGPVLAVRRHHKWDVRVLTTIHPPTAKGWQKPGQGPVIKPACILDYVSKMGDVDLMDQVTKYYSALRHKNKWWQKLAHYLLELAGSTAYQLFPPKMGQEFVYKKFLTDLVRQFIRCPHCPQAQVPTDHHCQQTLLFERTALFVHDFQSGGSQQA